jgi:hypothetical protein
MITRTTDETTIATTTPKLGPVRLGAGIDVGNGVVGNGVVGKGVAGKGVAGGVVGAVPKQDSDPRQSALVPALCPLLPPQQLVRLAFARSRQPRALFDSEQKLVTR